MALFVGPTLVTILRDDSDTIPWPNRWDLVGGGREGDESAMRCACREAQEEIGLAVAPEQVSWGRRYQRDNRTFWFFAAHLPAASVDDIRFGDEGQCFKLVTPDDYLANQQAITHFQTRLSDYLSGKASHL